MNNKNLVFHFLAITATLFITLSACKRINEATDLGSGLIPPIDNITTFETYLDVVSDNELFTDTIKVYGDDYLAIGHITSDPEFGSTHANAYFDISSPGYMSNPFINKDSVVGIDSVVLSLSYVAAYGDTNTSQTLRVYEIAQNAGFQDTNYYRYNQIDFLTTGTEIGNKTFQIRNLDDSIFHIRKRDTTKLANVIRIPLSTNIGQRFSQYDTMNASTGGFRSDSLFKKLFKGLAIVADNSGNALSYIDPSDVTKTRLSVYVRVKNSGTIDTTVVNFTHQPGSFSYSPYFPSGKPTVGQANTIKRTPGGNWMTYLANSTLNDDRIFLQSLPGSYASIKIPALDTFRNSVIHRAELILTPLRTAQDGLYTQPSVLFLDRINSTGDSAFTFDNDMRVPESTTSTAEIAYDLSFFGGLLKSDSTYRFNLSRYVQNMVTKRTANQKLRLYAPVRAFVFSPYLISLYPSITINRVSPGNLPAYGRVALTGGSYAVAPEKRMRMRVVYSKL